MAINVQPFQNNTIRLMVELRTIHNNKVPLIINFHSIQISTIVISEQYSTHVFYVHPILYDKVPRVIDIQSI